MQAFSQQESVATPFSLSFLARYLGGELSPGDGADPLLSGVALSSQEAAPGLLFLAVPGLRVDGHDFLDEAFKAGATAALVSKRELLKARPGIVVPDVRASQSRLAALFAGDPSRRMTVVGVTGTNGKTTIHWLLFHLLNKLGMPSMRVGTLGIEIPRVSREASLTTPDALMLHRSLRLGLDNGMHAAVMEVSSHGLEQRRVDDICFDIAIFSNLTRDHLDYHGNFEAYFAAKERLFELISKQGKGPMAGVLNLDNTAGQQLAAKLKTWGLTDFSFGSVPAARLCWSDFTQGLNGSRMKFTVDGKVYKICTPLVGRHNAENMAAVFSAALALGFDGQAIAESLYSLPQVPGRLEAVGGDNLGVYVDYAHTPNALENVLQALRPLTHGKLWVVFGCGGDRDRGKRPEMAEIACRLADQVVVTSDNPRTEDARAIIDEIVAGGRDFALVEPDRRSAISQAIAAASPGDVVLIAGKGHEDYQIIGTEKIHFSDQEEAAKALADRNERMSCKI
ncbi:MAG: UDP-N-acetylmuramoyl-L-alanyl-D-glutamate--2,6-diaminopimelate ligase [Deltaproteobacteria bacterium]|nr:UDP-N-acetylmuramoyl-L-alanyl-D-glutamate--2,6-diaminopimelate ligase [Deltaproteobacteria bacterium]